MNEPISARPPAVTAAVAIVFVVAVYAALLSIGHLGVEVPGLSALGPGGDRVVLRAGILFAVAALLYAVIGIGLLQLRSWAWAAGIVVSALSILSGLVQFRGAGSVIGMLLNLALLVLLLTPQVRSALRG